MSSSIFFGLRRYSAGVSHLRVEIDPDDIERLTVVVFCAITPSDTFPIALWACSPFYVALVCEENRFPYAGALPIPRRQPVNLAVKVKFTF